MFVRILEEQDILPALHLTWEVFAADVAPTYPPEGVAEFQKFIKYENILPLVRNGEMVFFGAWEGQELWDQCPSCNKRRPYFPAFCKEELATVVWEECFIRKCAGFVYRG
ncbi:MAG: hypothetical protein V8S08_07355 [Lachnoclostridium sp.]